jgi:hypothetical protein
MSAKYPEAKEISGMFCDDAKSIAVHKISADASLACPASRAGAFRKTFPTAFFTAAPSERKT